MKYIKAIFSFLILFVQLSVFCQVKVEKHQDPLYFTYLVNREVIKPDCKGVTGVSAFQPVFMHPYIDSTNKESITAEIVTVLFSEDEKIKNEKHAKVVKLRYDKNQTPEYAIVTSKIEKSDSDNINFTLLVVTTPYSKKYSKLVDTLQQDNIDSNIKFKRGQIMEVVWYEVKNSEIDKYKKLEDLSFEDGNLKYKTMKKDKNGKDKYITLVVPGSGRICTTFLGRRNKILGKNQQQKSIASN